MSNCTDCREVETICEDKKPCGCPIQDLSTDCVKYDGPALECSGITTPDILTQVIHKLDKFICDKFENTFIGELLNIGTGAKIYKRTNITGRQEVRTLESEDNSIVIEEKDNTISFSIDPSFGDDKYATSFTLEDKKLKIGLNDDTFLTPLDISSINTDNFLSDHPTYTDATGSLVFPMNDGTNWSVSLNPLKQKQSDVTQTDLNDKSFIKNQNPTKVIIDDYVLKPEDNNYVIIADTTNKNINIAVPNTGTVSFPPTDNYFVGFLQKGNNSVNITGVNTTPIGYINEIKGEGHNAAVEIVDISGTSNVFLVGSLKEQV